MKVIQKTVDSPVASVYVAENRDGKLIEFVESTQPPLTFKEKLVIVISTLYGCPVNCKFCDAGGNYSGVLSIDDLFYQVEYILNKRFPDGIITSERLKVQLARMGEPAFNNNVLEFLRIFPDKFIYRSFIPSLSTIAPSGSDIFFDDLLEIKKSLYDDTFQLQFSIHSTDFEQRRSLIPVKTWSFEQIAEYSKNFYSPNGKKISLNFALSTQSIFDLNTLAKYFSPELFLIKITPLNPTRNALKNDLRTLVKDYQSGNDIVSGLNSLGYDTILSIGEYEENYIGSNCGQYVNSINNGKVEMTESYTYQLIKN